LKRARWQLIERLAKRQVEKSATIAKTGAIEVVEGVIAAILKMDVQSALDGKQRSALAAQKKQQEGW
jgi:hypothetical protein